jgi:hypothetical protein
MEMLHPDVCPRLYFTILSISISKQWAETTLWTFSGLIVQVILC